MESFIDGFARIQNEDGSWNYIDKNCNFLLQSSNFHYISPFINGFAKVQNNDGMWNFIKNI